MTSAWKKGDIAVMLPSAIDCWIPEKYIGIPIGVIGNPSIELNFWGDDEFEEEMVKIRIPRSDGSWICPTRCLTNDDSSLLDYMEW